MTVGLARVAIASGIAPNRWPRRPPPGAADAPMTTRSACSASRRIAARTFEASRRTALAPPSRCWRTKAVSARSACARTASGDPGRDEVEDGARRRGARRWHRRSAGRARRGGRRGPGRGPVGCRVAPRCLTTAMSHGDSRRTSSIVGENGRGQPPSRRGRRLAAPAEDDEVGLLLRRGLDDALGGVASDPDDAGGSSCHPGRSRGPAGAGGGRGGLESRPPTGACPRGPRRCRAPSARRPRVEQGRPRVGSAPPRSPGWRPG